MVGFFRKSFYDGEEYFFFRMTTTVMYSLATSHSFGFIDKPYIHGAC